jgi:CRP-like cAMP-binding protein
MAEPFAPSKLEAILSCSPLVASALMRHGAVRALPPRTRLAAQGDVLGMLWLIVEGRLALEAVSSNGRVSRLGVHGPGDWIGNYARPALCVADVVALERVTLVAFPSGRLPEIVSGEPQVGAALAGAFARQLEATLARLDARSTLTSKGRIFAELLRRAGDAGDISPPPVVSELALAAQTTRETASRAMGELERRGIILRRGERLSIVSPRLLAEMVV